MASTTNINCIYDDEEYAWVSEEITIEGNTMLFIELKDDVGYVVIKRQDAVREEDPIMYASCEDDKFEIPFYFSNKDVTSIKIKIYTSVEPSKIRYANI